MNKKKIYTLIEMSLLFIMLGNGVCFAKRRQKS
jgi:hypothetical protein